MGHIETKVSGELVYDGKIIKLYVDQAELENGTIACREYISHCGGAAILAETEEGILFVEQFRYPYGEVLLELPAGKRDGDEDPAETAVRELEEETGYFPQKLMFLGEIYPSPGYTDEKIFLYFADGLEKRVQHTDDDEFLSVKAIKVEKVAEMIATGEIKDAKTIVAVLKYLGFYRR